MSLYRRRVARKSAITGFAAGETFAAADRLYSEAISFFNDAGSVRYLENRNLTALSRQVCAKRT